jgi:hypothetical protein
MGSGMSHMLWSDKLQGAQTKTLDLIFPITAAKTVTATPGVLTAFDAVASQAVIDSFLGTTNEFLVAAFDATAMGTDAFAAIVAMEGQCKELVSADATSYTSAGAVSDEKHVLDSAALTASTLETKCAKGADGNVALKVVLTGVDALTAGYIHVKLHYLSK